MIGIGDSAPEFDLSDTDGEPAPFETPAVVIFTCNHCPYALAWHDRLLAVARDYADRDVRVLFINSNDAALLECCAKVGQRSLGRRAAFPPQQADRRVGLHGWSIDRYSLPLGWLATRVMTSCSSR